MDRVLDSFFSPGTPQSPITPFTPEAKPGSFASTGSSDSERTSQDIPELIAQQTLEPLQKAGIVHCDPTNLPSPNEVNLARGAASAQAPSQELQSACVEEAAGPSPVPPVDHEKKNVLELHQDQYETTCLSSFAGLSTSERRQAGTAQTQDENGDDDDSNLSVATSPEKPSSSTLVEVPPAADAASGQDAVDTPCVFFYNAKPRLNQFVGLIDYLLLRGHQHTTGKALQPMTPEETATHDEFICYANVESLAEAATQVLKKEPNMLDIQVPEDEVLVVVGDIHGQFVDMYYNVLTQQISDEYNPHQVDKRFLFLGDLVDRGPFSVEVCMLVLALKVEFPDLVHLTRGNHEESKTSRVYGFLTESQAKFGDKGTWAWDKMNQAFRHIPLCAIVKTPKMRFFATHGGITPALHDDVATVAKVERAAYCYTLKGEQEDLVNGLLWSDPTVEVGTYTRNPRGCGVQFGRLATDTFCSHNNVDFICRAHQVVMDGYCWQHRDKIVTVFSAPNYCGINDNLGAIMIVRGDARKPSFVQYEAFELDDDDTAPAPDGNFAYASCFQ